MGAKISAVILGLPESFRGEILTKLLDDKGIPFKIHWGLNGYIDEETVDGFRRPSTTNFLYSRKLTYGEIACQVGHYQIYRSSRNEIKDWLLVLEDNAVVEDFESVKEVLEKNISESPMLINFGESRYCLNFLSFGKKPSNRLYRNYTIPTNTKCYAVNQSALHRIVEGFEQWGEFGYQADYPPFFFDVLKFYYLSETYVRSDGTSLIGIRRNQGNSRGILVLRRILKYSFFPWILYGRKFVSFKSYFSLTFLRFLAERIR